MSKAESIVLDTGPLVALLDKNCKTPLLLSHSREPEEQAKSSGS